MSQGNPKPVPALSPEPSLSKEQLEIANLRAELAGRTLDIESRTLRWWKRPDYLTPLIPSLATVVAAIIGFLYLLFSGWLDDRRDEAARLRSEVAQLSTQRDLDKLRYEQERVQYAIESSKLESLTAEKENLQASLTALGKSAELTREHIARISRINLAGGTVTTLTGDGNPAYQVSFASDDESVTTPIPVEDSLPPGDFSDYLHMVKDNRSADLTAVADDLARLPNLIAVQVDVKRFGLSPEAVRKLAESPTLTHLELYNDPISDETLAEIASLNFLETLSCDCRDPIALPPLANMTRLKVLALRGVQLSATNVHSICGAENLAFLAVDANSIDIASLPELQSLKKLSELVLVSSPIGDAGLEILSRHGELTRLAFSGTGVTDKGLETLSALRKLRHLHLWNSNSGITDAGLRAVSSLSELESFVIDAPGLTDGSIGHIQNLEKLKLLALAHCKITGAAVRNLKSLPRLEALCLHGCWINDDGIKELQNMRDLRVLDLSQTHTHRIGVSEFTPSPLGVLTDGGLIGFRNLRNLQVLDLAGNDISDEGISHLASLRSLRYLRISRTKVTTAGESKLRSLLPQALVD